MKREIHVTQRVCRETNETETTGFPTTTGIPTAAATDLHKTFESTAKQESSHDYHGYDLGFSVQAL